MGRSKKEPASEAFLRAFGVGAQYRKYEPADDARLAPRIPNAMREVLKKDGWGSYKEQVLWLCDPDDWKAAVPIWFPTTPRSEVLGRTAFGDLFVWDGQLFWFAMVHEASVMGSV